MTSLCTRRFLSCFRRHDSRLSILFVSTLAALCPRSVDINPGQGGKNVCFGHVRSSAAGVRKMQLRKRERGKQGEREKESEDIGSTTFVSRSLIFRYCLFSIHPCPSYGFSLSLYRALSDSIVLLSVLLRVSPHDFDEVFIFFFSADAR